ncbi:oxidoreductase [Vibrio ziniensis]|uniref:Oxidoreductase n=1 Tax=Vibrio ziniensis TaxID=2711221 RepID=A0A6G7CP15_9VIBR|nr:oxidoreductase [Vibrio ziniensis]QIH43829.1 oxidoreductase [Vibrio ziniensis]
MKRILVVTLLFMSTFASAYDLTIKLPNQEPIVMSMNQLKSVLPVTAFTTHTPWSDNDQPISLTGFTMLDLLNYIKAKNVASVSFIALNDYSSSTSIDDLKRYKPIVAYSLDGEPMRVRDKGPFWFIYDMSTYPQTDSPGYHTQMVWQIKEISIKYK